MSGTIVFVTFDGGGNVPPLVGIARELVDRGHRVRVIGGTLVPGGMPSPRLREAFERVGCEVVALAAAVGIGEPPSTAIVVAAIPRQYAFMQVLAMCASLSSHWALSVAPQIAERRPDIVLVDVSLPGAALAAEAAGVPYAGLHHTILDHRLLPEEANTIAAGDSSHYREVYTNVALPYLNEAREHLGLPPTGDPWQWQLAAERMLVLTSPAFDGIPETLPSHWRYTGAVRDQPSGSQSWDSPWLADDPRPLVVASSTTTSYAAIWKPAIAAIVDACAVLPVRLLLTIGSHLDASEFPAHENVCIRERVPHDAVLPKAALIISQCGHGTTMTALRHGVPIVCIPGFADQPEVAARIVVRGTGVRLRTRPSAEDVRTAVTTVLTEPSYKEAAQRLGDIIARENGAAVAADEVESVLRASR